jgi:hypothetical protein
MEYRLAFDMARCFPMQPDEWCKQCLRWNDLPNQTFGDYQPGFSAISSTDETCKFIPLKETK